MCNLSQQRHSPYQFSLSIIQPTITIYQQVLGNKELIQNLGQKKGGVQIRINKGLDLFLQELWI